MYQTLLDIMQHPQGKERETRLTGTTATPTLVTGTAAEPENQPVLVSVAPIQKKKYTKKSVRSVKDDNEPGSLREQEEEAEPEIITRSLSLSKLQDMRKDFSRLPGSTESNRTPQLLSHAILAVKQAEAQRLSSLQTGPWNVRKICYTRKSSMVSYRQSRRLLECVEDNCIGQVIDSPTKGDAILDLLVTNASELISDIKTGGSLGCSDYALVEFAVLRDMSQDPEF
ncbi:ubiquitin carboxyl-terminal hydrolase 4 [Limosa lapponica baueri]|uniref:Ubiquitin carboxyl-terminal hydrolase 4 n=1 Tax=Limosa lapponica baueri TaxID=1758121 RepID=A0A2I0TLR5_LIMLA|nr:ubiquitin carboxyl-terminal hydrolase 4 [Limosa lapponica baueri]